MVERYIGIENELISFKREEKINAGEFFSHLKEDSDYEKTESSIRTTTGHGYYVDGSELEILTPPVAINKGFATRLTDLLMIGREKVIKSTENIKHTNYSMHWNITNTNKRTNYPPIFREGIVVPFHLFGLTPLSNGLKVQLKGEPNSRYEIRGDSLVNENQIKATSLLIGAYSYAIEKDNKTPLPLRERWRSDENALFLPDGRHDQVSIFYDGSQKEIPVQQYLELFYHWIKPFVSKLGTKKEIQNLEDFISGSARLEFDDFKYFADLWGNGWKNQGVYLPFNIKNSTRPNQVLESTGERELPLEGKLLGEIVKKCEIKLIDWSFLKINTEKGQKEIQGIENIYAFANKLNPDLPKFKPAYNPEENIIPNKIRIDKIKNILEYNPNKDNSLNLESNRFAIIKRHLTPDFKGGRIDKLLGKALICLLTGTLLGWAGQCTYHQIDENKKADSIIKQENPISSQQNLYDSELKDLNKKKENPNAR